MGIYPDKKLTPTSTGYIEEIRAPGLIRRRELTASKWTEERSDCFCCSCDDDSSVADPACRNHGWWGKRPCEAHSMPGAKDDEGVMPISVQAKRSKNQGVSL
jgi:hypothetical protein